jgi:hypothetical protein
MKRWSVGKLWIARILCGLIALYFGSWFIQTAWLGSFPGADRDYYGRWSLIQFVVSIVFFVAMLAAGVVLFAAYRNKRQHGNAHG